MSLSHADFFLNVGDGHFTSPQEVQDLDPFRIRKGFTKFRMKFVIIFLHGKLLAPFFIFHRKYFSNPTFIHLAQIAFFVYELCLGGRTG